MTKDAVLSDDGRYRYLLSRTWDVSRPPAVFVMLNPSTADANEDDPTILRCIDFARRFDLGALWVVNLYAYRATDPAELKRVSDPVGPQNDHYVRGAFDLANPDNYPGTRLICAWGSTDVWRSRERAVVRMARDMNATLECLGHTKTGGPRHPLYLRKTDVPRPFRPREDF